MENGSHPNQTQPQNQNRKTPDSRTWMLQPSFSLQGTTESSQGISGILLYVAVLVLMICVVGGILAGLNYATQGKIEENEIAQLNKAFETIFPDADEFDNVFNELNDTSSIPGVSAVYKVYKNEELLGYCTQVASDGFGTDEIEMIVGSDTMNQVVLISVLDHTETPGKGADILDPDEVFLQQFKGLARPIEFTSNVTAVSGATTTSDGVRNGINMALKAVDLVRISIDDTIGGNNE